MPTAKQMPWARADHGGGDADDLAGGIDQRAAGVAGVERGIGLDDRRDRPAVAGAQRAAEAADDAGGDGRLEAERVADCEHELADAEVGAASEGRVVEAVAGKAEHGEVGGRVVADHNRRDLAAVGERRGQGVGAGDDVAVGERVAVGGEHDARTTAGGARAAARGDVDDRGGGALHGVGDGAGERVERVEGHGQLDVGPGRSGIRPDGWGGVVAAARDRLARSRQGAGADAVAGAAGRRHRREAWSWATPVAALARQGRPGRSTISLHYDPGRISMRGEAMMSTIRHAIEGLPVADDFNRPPAGLPQENAPWWTGREAAVPE